jgi:hypothetical protein
MANSLPNGAAGFHWKAIDLMIRILMPVIVVLLTILASVVIANQAKLAELEARMQTVEARTAMLPPIDYRTYIDSKFAETNRRLDELHNELQAHSRSGQ